MTRFLVLIVSPLVVLGAIFFFLVWQAQPAAALKISSQPERSPTGLSAVQSKGGIGPGKLPWAQNYDNGRLSSEFTADDFTPQKDGSFFLNHPIYVFYFANASGNDGRLMRVSGDTATINCDAASPNSSKGMFATPGGTPKNGWLHKVRIELYDSATATSPSLWMETDNIHFDNDTLRMYTESFVGADGKTVAADQVPVTARGDDYEFDGKGLTLHWNGRDDRLQLLEVMHGQRLEMKNPSKISLPGMGKAEAAKPVAVSSSAGGSNLSLVSLVKPVEAKKPDKPVIPYRAVFNDDVKITQLDHTMGTANTMSIDFLQGANKSPAMTAPATAVPTPAPSINPKPATSPTTSATTQPSKGPITITWVGKLTIKPLETEPLMPLLPGQSVVQLVGTPARLTPDGSELDAASATYRSPDGAVRLEHSTTQPDVLMTQINGKTNAVGLTLKTKSLVYDPATSLATLIGASELQVPTGDHQQVMKVTWNQTGQLHLPRLPSEQQPRGVDHVDLTGDVVVTHPQFKLNSRDLLLDLDLIPRSPGSQNSDEQLKTITAVDNVVCKLLHAGKPTQGINSDQLIINTVRTDSKQTVPREVLADGDVYAYVNEAPAKKNQPDGEPAQSLTAGHLQAFLVAKTAVPNGKKPAADDMSATTELESLYVTDNVHAKAKGGAFADADQLRVTMVNGKQLVELSGATSAKLNDGKGSFLDGSVVHVTSDQRGVAALSVDGAGMLETVHTPGPSTRPANAGPPKPIDISWTDSMSMNERSNLGDVVGHVIVKNVDAAGNHSTMTGDTAHLLLMDPPKTSKKPTTRDTTGSVAGNKQLKQLTLTGNVRGITDLITADGTVLRHGDLYGDQLIYTAATGVDNATVEIPGAGKLFLENHRPDTKQANNSRGAMAISWEKDLIYNQASDQITFQGSTAAGFEQEAKPGKDGKTKPATPMLLNADTLVVTLAKAPPSPATPATKPVDEGAGKLQLSKMQANGQVVFHAQTLELTCTSVDYDPHTGLMIAHGSPQERGQTRDATHNVIGSFDELMYDTAIQEIQTVKGLQGQMQK